jgi:uncharacterized protein
MSKDTTLFYHARCPDGFGSAYAFWRKFGDTINYHALGHHKRSELNLNEYKGQRVFMADISLERARMLELNDVAEELVVLDHHKSAMEDLEGLDFCHFDMKRSGAVMSWDYLFNRPAPRLLRFVQDRDLWNWELENSDDVLLYADSVGYDFEKWKDLELEFEKPERFETVLAKGAAIKQYRDGVVRNMLEYTHTLNIRGYEIPAINTPFFRSEIVGQLAAPSNVPFAAGYNFDGEMYGFSLRSTDEGVDVAKIAESFPGGGGHRNASGFGVKSLEELS